MFFMECLIERLICAYEVGNQEEMTAVSQQNGAQDQTRTRVGWRTAGLGGEEQPHEESS